MTSKTPFGRAALAASVALPCLLAAAGCTVGPNFTAPDGRAPVSWFAARPAPKPVRSEPVAEPIDPNWWTLFHDKQLTALEDRVAAQNLDVRLATIRIAESRAQRGVVAAAQFPTLGGNASYEREKASNNGVFGLLGSAAAGSEASGAGGGLGAGGVNGTNLAPFDLYQYGRDARSNPPTRRSPPRPRRGATRWSPPWPRWRATTSTCAAPSCASGSPTTT
jgi:outer membrane protein TolC